jgi:D-alanyl-D-alanine endopeptidase (penicillin-binding protein 7)
MNFGMKLQFFSFYSSVVALLAVLVFLVGMTALFARNERVPLYCAVELCSSQMTVPYSTTSTVLQPLRTVTTTPIELQTLSAVAVVVVDDETGAVLWERASMVERPLASITKLMTALVLSELPMRWDATTTISEADSDGSGSHVKVGEIHSVIDLWRAALIGSSNTAVQALVRMSGVSSTDFVARMNAKAQRLAMPSLHFVEPTGLDPRNVGTARDVVRLLRFALKKPEIESVLKQPQMTLFPRSEQARVIWSTNWLLTKWIPHSFADSVVGKTGYIGDSGYNFAVRVTDKFSNRLRIVVLGTESSDARFVEARKIGEWIFATTVWQAVSTTRP